MGKERGVHEEDGNGALRRGEGGETGKARKKGPGNIFYNQKSLVGHQGVPDSLWESRGRMTGISESLEG